MSSASVANYAQVSPAYHTSSSQKNFFGWSWDIISSMKNILQEQGFRTAVLLDQSNALLRHISNFCETSSFSIKKMAPELWGNLAFLGCHLTSHDQKTAKTSPNDFILFSRDAPRSPLSNALTFISFDRYAELIVILKFIL